MAIETEKIEEMEKTTSFSHIPKSSVIYVDAKARYQEYKSSSIMFLVFAVLFFVFGILNISGIVTLMASTVSLILLFAFAIGFLAAGIGSLKKVASLKEEAVVEETSTETILTYLNEHFPKEVLFSMEETDGLSKELLYFQHIEKMKEAVQQEFPDKNENYLDSLLEDYYNQLEV